MNSKVTSGCSKCQKPHSDKKGSSDYFDFVQVRAYLKESGSFRGSKEITFEKTFVLFFLKLIKVNVFLTLSL